MQSYEALQMAINGKTVEHAKRLALSTSIVNKFQEPHTDFTDSGAFNPLDRIKTIIETSLALGQPPERALAPLYFLAESFNQIVFPAPPPGKNLSEIHKELSRLTKDFGDVLSVTGARLSDGEISGRDALAIKKEASEMQRALASFVAKIEEISKR